MFGDVEMMQSYVYGWEREGGEGRGGGEGGGDSHLLCWVG